MVACGSFNGQPMGLNQKAHNSVKAYPQIKQNLKAALTEKAATKPNSFCIKNCTLYARLGQLGSQKKAATSSRKQTAAIRTVCHILLRASTIVQIFYPLQQSLLGAWQRPDTKKQLCSQDSTRPEKYHHHQPRATYHGVPE